MAFVAPTKATVRQRYPAMLAVADPTLDYWLGEAALDIGASWPDRQRARAQMAYVAHWATVTAVNPATGSAAVQGITSFRSGTFSVAMSDSAAAREGYGVTMYGRELLALYRVQFGGPRIYGPAFC